MAMAVFMPERSGRRVTMAALLMRIDHDLTAKVIQCGIQGHNGLAFSLNNQWMYTSDTPNGVIYRTLLDKHGEPGKRELFQGHFGEGEGLPDGAAMDKRRVLLERDV